MTAQIVPFNHYMDPQPTEQERALWDKFVEEYTKDYNPVEAAQRLGFNLTFAVEYSKVFLSKPYVQQLLMEHKRTPINEKDHVEKIKAMIEATLVECMQNGQPATRVVAAKTLAGIHGIDQAPDRSGEELQKLVDTFKAVAKHLPD